MAPSTSTLVTITAATLVGSFVAYAVWFDYKRKNDPTFRKKLRKEKKKLAKVASSSEALGFSRSPEEIKAALQVLRSETLPSTAEEREQYFMDNVAMGESLCARGPAFELPAALSFYRAMRVYPSPVELIMIYQKTVPESVFKIVMEMTSLDVKERAEGYYDKFPDQSMNVSVTQVPLNDPKVPSINGKPVKKNILVANRDFAAGELIYKEHPIVVSLDADLEGKGKYCTNCLREIPDTQAIIPEDDPLRVAFCSEECQQQANANYHNLLFGKRPPVEGLGVSAEIDPVRAEARATAQDKAIKYTHRSGRIGLMLVGRFIARMVAEETKKLANPNASGSDSGNGLESQEYSLFDHLERLRFLEIPESEWEGQAKILTDVLKLAADGLEEFLKDDRYGVLLGKMAYNAIGVSFGNGRLDKPESQDRPEDRERSRTPNGTTRQIGAGLYFVSSYMSHSCSPSAIPSFPNGTAELHLVAANPIKKGDELTIAYVDVNPTDDVLESRRLRRHEIARGWRFACDCTRCKEETPATSDGTSFKDDVKIEGPSAQVDEAVLKYESGSRERTAEIKEDEDTDTDVQ